MTWFDYAGIVIIAYFLIRGFLRGFLRGLTSFIGILMGFIFSGRVAPVISQFLIHLGIKSNDFLPLLSIAIAFLIIYMGFFILGIALKFLLDTLSLGMIDRILGMGFGFVKASLLITLIYLAVVLSIPSYKKDLNRSKIYPLVYYTLSVTKKLLPSNWISALEHSKKLFLFDFKFKESSL